MTKKWTKINYNQKLHVAYLTKKSRQKFEYLGNEKILKRN